MTTVQKHVKKAWVISLVTSDFEKTTEELLVIIGPKPTAYKAMIDIKAALAGLYARTEPDDWGADQAVQKSDRGWARGKLPHGCKKPSRYGAQGDLIMEPIPLKVM